MEILPYEDDPGAWDGFVRAQEGWTHFHLFGWKAVIEETFRHECPYLVAVDEGRISGVTGSCPASISRAKTFSCSSWKTP